MVPSGPPISLISTFIINNKFDSTPTVSCRITRSFKFIIYLFFPPSVIRSSKCHHDLDIPVEFDERYLKGKVWVERKILFSVGFVHVATNRHTVSPHPDPTGILSSILRVFLTVAFCPPNMIVL